MNSRLIIIISIFAASLILQTFIVPQTTNNLTTFESEQDFLDYLSTSTSSGAGGFGGIRTIIASAPSDLSGGATQEKTDGETQTSRYSETNVQVEGIDEPDIVKTDGKNIYYSGYYNTKIITAYPVTSLNVSKELKKTGNLFLKNNTLIILSYNEVLGVEKESGNSLWNYELNGSIVDARVYGDYAYIITQGNINYYRPCPLYPAEGIIVKCGEIYHPIYPVNIDATYHIMSINLIDGSIKDVVSFVGRSWSSVIYMSQNAIYATYEKEKNILIDFYVNECRDLLPNDVLTSIDKIKNYEISEYSKQYEIQNILYTYYSSLSNDERLRIETEIQNRAVSYIDRNKRELIKTGIIKISFNEGDLEIQKTAEIPGQLLNQFSLDEYNNYLRAAVTVGTSNTSNDIYVLNNDLSIVGELKDLGVSERVYSARFLGNKAYIVTFRQTDPFYIIDLSNPQSPQLKGELKIPGYSSYLHPLLENKILGIGKEESFVKLSIFDVSNPENPTETSKYTLNEYWSEILSTHRAFLIDKEKEIFFLPASKGGYFFSYKEGLSLVKAISANNPRRAVYIDDVMYVISYNELIALNETSWETINKIDIGEDYPIYIK